MEWVLQVVDEIDDVIASVRHHLLGHNVRAVLIGGCAAVALSAAVGVAIAHS